LQRSASSQSDDRNGFANTLHFESCFIHSVFTNLYARQYSPENPSFPYSLGLLAAERKDLESAVGFLEETVAIEPSFSRAWYNLSLAYGQLNRTEDAARAMQRAQAGQ
jgi:tetratricopeptide (TPR) repeat protein